MPEALPPSSRGGDRTGEQVGRYTLLAQIAEGGMGAVYVALMRGPADFSRLVAIKCVHTRWLDDSRLVARFKNEIQLSARVLHPNVVQTLDVVETAGELFLVMDYADGVTLAALLGDLSRQSEPMAVSHAAAILVSVLRGLHAAHEARDETGRPLHIVHRDVSPQNVMVGRNGHVQVLDFGVAKVLEHSQHTAVGTVLGRLAYMAPEQLQGASSSPRTDVFGAGVVLWECLAGKRLFHRGNGSEGELIYGLLSQPIPRMSSLRADIPPALDLVLARALDRNAEQRFQSAEELARALEAAVPLAPTSAISLLVSQASGARLTAREALIQRTRQEVLAAAPLLLQTELLPRAEIVTVKTSALQPARRRSSAGRRLPWLGGMLVAAGAAWVAARLSLERAAAPELAAGSRPSPGLAADQFALDPARAAAPSEVAPAPVQPFALATDANAGEVSAAEPAAATAPRAARKAQPASRRAGLGGRRSGATDALEQSATAGADAPRHDPCDPPTYVGEDGIRRFKKSCL